MSHAYTDSLNRLIEEFSHLPGIGPKSAERLAFHILKSETAEAMARESANQAGYAVSFVKVIYIQPPNDPLYDPIYDIV